MPSILQRLKWVVDSESLAFKEEFSLAVATILQGYIEDDHLKFRTGAYRLHCLKSLDSGKLLTDDFIDILEMYLDIYCISEEGSEELIKKVENEDMKFNMEINSVFRIHDEWVKKKMEVDKNGSEEKRG